MSFEPAKKKVAIGSLDEPGKGLEVSAQYNPKELQIDKSVPWQQHNKSNANGMQLEFTGAAPREMSLELFFDGYEGALDVQAQVKKLEQLASVRDPSSTDPKMRRPHHCVVSWGTVMGGSDNKFKCVIESMSTKYTMFSSEGQPLRATITLKLKEAERVSMAAGKSSAAKSSTSGSGKRGGK